MRLVAFNYGRTELSESVAFQGGSPTVNLPIDLLFFLLEIDDKRILIDVGCDDMPKFHIYKFKKPVEVLEMYGMKPQDITDIYLTHAHHDHIGAIGYYKRADIHFNEHELQLALKRLPTGCKIHTFGETTIISEGITVKHIGGHTKGSSIILIEAENTTYVLCGDECYFMQNLTENRPTATTACLENSMAFVEEYRKPQYTPILFHDTELVADIGYKVIFDTERD